MKRTTMVVVSVALAAMGSGCAAGTSESGEDLNTNEAALLGAERDSEHLFDVGLCVGQLKSDGSCPKPGTPATSRCSATLVAPNLVLTARHCFETAATHPSDFCERQFTGAIINSTMQITTGDTVLQAGDTWHSVQSVHKPTGNNACTDDIALLVLQDNVTDVSPASIDLQANLATSPPSAFAIVGRGALVEVYDPNTLHRIAYDNGNYYRRKLENIPFVCAPTSHGECDVVDYWSNPPEFSPPPGLFAYGPSGATGDSGAGVIPQDRFAAQNFSVVGVNTLGTMAADGTSSGSQAVRLDQHAAFIKSVAQAAATSGGYTLPTWAQ
jgi:hypothetical protein